MKNLFYLFAALFLFVSCNDDSAAAPPPAVDTIADFTSGLFLQSSPINSGDYEFGLEFSSTVAGSITEFKLNLPDTDTYRVTLWNAATETVITDEMVSATANIESVKAITPVAIAANAKYMITVQSDDWNEYYSDDTASTDVVPATVGNFTFHRYGYNGGTAQDFPDVFPNNYYAGIASFTFQPN